MDPVREWAQYQAASGLARNTIQLRLRTIHALTIYAGVGTPLKLQPHHVAGFLARPISPWSRLTYWKAIGAWCTYVRDFGHTANGDLLANIPRPHTPTGVPRPIDDACIARLLKIRLSPRAYAYVRLALYQALRVHEIAKLRGEDFDLAAGWLIIEGKGGHVAPIPIHPEIARMAETMPEHGYWFPSRSSPYDHVNPVAVSQTIIGALRSVGSTATAHQLRDTAATRMQRVVKDIRLTQSMLRHRSIRSTQKYSGVADDALQAAVLSLDWSAA